MQYFVRSGALSHFTELVLECGQAPRRLLREVGLSAGALSDPDLYIPYVRMAALMELAADRCRVRDFGVRLAERQGIEMAGALGSAIILQPDIGSALRMLQQNFDFHARGVRIEIEDAPDAVVLRLGFDFVDGHEYPQMQALSVGILVRAIGQLHDETLVPLDAALAIDGELLTSHYRRVLGCRARGDALENCVRYPLGTLQRPVVIGDAVRHRINTRWRRDISARRDVSLKRQVERAITALLPTRECQLEMVSQTLELHPRMLQRRLKADGTSFGAMLAGVRLRLACHYLANTDMPITELAMNLGFSDAAAFSHMFRKCIKATPREWRNENATRGP